MISNLILPITSLIIIVIESVKVYNFSTNVVVCYCDYHVYFLQKYNNDDYERLISFIILIYEGSKNIFHSQNGFLPQLF